MGKTVILIAGTVVAVNLIYQLLPNGNFEKYSKFIFGLVLILVFAGTITNVNISSNVLEFNGEAPVYNHENIKQTIYDQTEKLIENKIHKHLTDNNLMIESISVILEENEIKNVVVVSESNSDAEMIRGNVSEFCEIGIEKVIVEQGEK